MTCLDGLQPLRRDAAEKEAAARLAWNERQTKRMPMLFSPTIAPAS
jgi:hypothetical protein